jgi:hypothetical protein
MMFLNTWISAGASAFTLQTKLDQHEEKLFGRTLHVNRNSPCDNPILFECSFIAIREIVVV